MMDWSLLASTVSFYLVCLVFSRLFDIVYRDFRSLHAKSQTRKHPAEDSRLSSLLAQYLPVQPKKFPKKKWWQYAQNGLYWLEPIANVYFFYLAIEVKETTPLLICIGSWIVMFLNNVWQTSEFSLLKKLRLTALLPSQLLPYFILRFAQSIKSSYKLLYQIIRTFSSRELNFPLRLGFSEKRH